MLDRCLCVIKKFLQIFLVYRLNYLVSKESNFSVFFISFNLKKNRFDFFLWLSLSVSPFTMDGNYSYRTRKKDNCIHENARHFCSLLDRNQVSSYFVYLFIFFFLINTISHSRFWNLLLFFLNVHNYNCLRLIIVKRYSGLVYQIHNFQFNAKL